MKIIVLGGYGVFGGRLCELLAQDRRISLWIAGRSVQAAKTFCRSLPQGAVKEALFLIAMLELKINYKPLSLIWLLMQVAHSNCMETSHML